MRVGTNPNRIARAEKYYPIVFAVVTHLPSLKGYHSERFEVVQTCIRSMRRNADMEHSLIIWDNGSCKEFRQWVRDEVKPHVFVESFNLGKTGARAGMFGMVPPGHIVCYSDDDMYFYPGWLIPQLELMRHFPNVACVSGYPVRTSFRWANENTVKWAAQHAEIQTGRFIPEQWEQDFADSLGREWSFHKDYTRNDRDTLITYRGRQAYATSHHCQFVTSSETALRIAKFDGLAMGDEKPLDYAMDELGLRLATTERLTRHMGNVIHGELRKEIEEAEKVAA